MSKKKELSKEISFEEALRQLEDITRSLESGSLTLDEAIKEYERGSELRKLCLEMLQRAEKKLEYIEKQEDGTVVKRSVENETDSEGSLF